MENPCKRPKTLEEPVQGVQFPREIWQIILQTKHEDAVDKMLPKWQEEHRHKMEPVLEELLFVTAHLNEILTPKYDWYADLLANPKGKLSQPIQVKFLSWCHLPPNPTFTPSEIPGVSKELLAALAEFAKPQPSTNVNENNDFIGATKCADCYKDKMRFGRDHKRHPPNRRMWYIFDKCKGDKDSCTNRLCNVIRVVNATPKGGLKIVTNHGERHLYIEPPKNSECLVM
jgi:hypothetical protein